MMMKKIASAATIVLFSGVSAIAQSTTDTTGTMSASGVAGWDQTTRDTFFSDGTTLRSNTEVQSGWESLDSAQQARVRADCETMQGDASASATTQDSADTTADASTSTSGSTSADSSSTATTSGADATAGADASTDMPDMASMTQLCDQIKSF